MGYLQALNLMVRAYKAARGVMPKGLDLLKLKMKARRKAIDAKKVIQFPPDKITPFYKPRNQIVGSKREKGLEIAKDRIKRLKETKPEGSIPVTVKGKTSKMSPEGIMKMLMSKGKDVKIGQAPKTTKVKEPVDPKLILQESEKEMAKRMMRENKEAIKRFKEKMKKPRDDKATGGLANLSQTYDNNPTLQSQFPDKQDYLDMFSSTTTTTPQTTTYTQMTEEAPAGIPAVKPIVPIIPIPGGDGGDGGGGITNIDRGLKSADDYGFGPYGNNFNKADVQKEIDALNPGGVKGFMQGIGNFYKTVSPFLNAKRALAKGQDFALELIQKAKEAAAARELAKLQEAARAAGFQGDTRTQSEQDFASSQSYGGGGSRGDMGADTFDI